MNINPRDLAEPERLVEEYRKEHERYLKIVQQASRSWLEKRESIFKQIFAE